MKRISFLTAALAVMAASPDLAEAVNPNQNQALPQQSNPYGTTTLPGQGGILGLFGNQSDPFFPPDPYGVNPIYPGSGSFQGGGVPGLQLTPNPNPGTYPDQQGRSRVTTPMQPNLVPGGQYQYPAQNTPRKWRLGVYSKDTDTGVKIHDVVNGGSAHRAGLEVNDQVVAVNGFQVGYVNGQLYDCGSEFERLADQNGWVTLLVLDNRTKQLTNVPVQLDSRLSTLQGSIALQNRQNLPANAVVNVELKEIIGANGNPVTFASTQVNKINTYPIPFAIDFDPAHISQNGQYVVYASILVNGRELYRTPQTVRVLDQVPPRPVALQLSEIRPGTGYPGGGTVLQDYNSQSAQIVNWFREYLGRNPTDAELVAWLDRLRTGQSISQVQLALLSNDTFFNRCDADKRVYIQRMHELMIGRQPTQEEMNYWLARYDYHNGIRRNLAQDFQGALGIN